MRSMDFHSAMVSPQDKQRKVDDQPLYMLDLYGAVR